MTPLDELLDGISIGIGGLSRRAQSAFFLACGTALLGEYERWATRRDIAPSDVVAQACSVARTFGTTGAIPPDKPHLLGALEAITPGESPDEVASTTAQDCLICIDCSLRVAIDEDFEAGPCVEYALQPVTEAASERLFGVSQIGSGPDELPMTRLLLNDARVEAATSFCHGAIEQLSTHPEPTADLLDDLIARARRALTP